MAVLKDLIVHGASRFLGGINTDSVKANTIDATNGYFKYLKAIDGDIENLSVEDLLAQKATVVGLLDVKGELHTNKWTNTNIANIGGVFYISPTVISTTATVVIGGSANSRTLTVSQGSFATTTVPTWNGTTESTSAWAVGSRVMVTGSVTYNNVEYPLGTCTGYISGALSSTGFTVQQIYSEALEDIFSIVGTASLAGSNIQISMYEIGPGNNSNQSNNASYKPIGILMTSYGMADKSTHIDIYGGTNAKNTSSKTSGMADPNVRIGYLGGLDSYTDSAGNTHQPTGWGIYTDNGYFKGVVVADSGLIGGFTIGTSNIHNGKTSKTETTNNGVWVGTDGIGFGKGVTYFSTDGTGKIGPWTLSSTALYNGSTGINNTTSGVYLGYTTNNTGLNISGGSAATTITISNSNFTKSINGTSYSTLRVAIGSNFGMDSSGNIYANGANITNINANNISTNLLSAIQAKVSTLSVITGDMGTLTSGKIVGGTITTNTNRTTYNATTAGLTIDSNGIGAGNGTKNTFKVVASTGILTATGATIEGAITASSLSTGGRTSSTAATGTYIDNTGAIYGGNNNFSVSNTGVLTAKSGNIGSWSIDTWLLYVNGNYSTSVGGSSISFEERSSGTVVKQTSMSLDEIQMVYYKTTGDTVNSYTSMSRNGQISLYNSTGASYVMVDSVASGSEYSCSLHASTAGNRGIYDDTTSKWIIWKNTNNRVYVQGDEVHLCVPVSGAPSVLYYQNSSTSSYIFRPSTNNSVYNGTSENRWKGIYGVDIYGTNAYHQSDLKNKKIIDDYDWKVDDFIRGLKPIAFNRIDENGNVGTRIKFGFGAQDVARLSKKLDVGDLSLYSAKIKDIDNKGNIIEKPYYGEDIDDNNLTWSLEYTNFIAPMVLEIQRLMNRVDILESEIKKLKS